MLPNIRELSEIIVQAADKELLPRFCHVGFKTKQDGSLVTEADVAMQSAVSSALMERWPQYELLGEEMDEGQQRRLLESSQAGLWCLDPVDGTSNFAAGLPFFSVSLALLIAREPVLGLVYDPMRKECFSAVKGEGAWLNGVLLGSPGLGRALKHSLAMVDFKRLSPEMACRLVEHPPYGSQRSLGSVALEWCWIAAGRCHVYLHGKQKLWDYAAGYLILNEAGGHATTLAGEEVFVPDMAPRSAVAALDEGLFNEWCAWLRCDD